MARNSFGSSGTSAVANVTVYPTPQYTFILDNPDTNVTFVGSWTTNTSGLNHYGNDYRSVVCASNSITATATYRPLIPANGPYDVFILYPSVSSASTNAQLTVVYNGGSTNISVQ